MKTLIIGRGEIGGSLFNILKCHYPVWVEDIIPERRQMKNCPKKIDVLHVCVRHSENFISIAKKYTEKYQPELIDICSTVPPGTTKEIRWDACHSTTRGLHPHLEEGLKKIPKHIGGPMYAELAEYFRKAGVMTVTHNKAATTELLHILNNVHYGINLMFSDEAAKLCREYGVDYYNYLRYTETNNMGYLGMDHNTKVRPILTPPGGKIGGHCITMSANLIPRLIRPPLIDKLARYNG